MFEVIFDTETKKFFDEIEGFDPSNLGVSIASLYIREVDENLKEVKGEMKSFWTDEELPRPLEGLGNALSSHMLIPLFNNLIANGKETSIPKSEKTYQSTGPDIPNTQSSLNVAEISEYLNNLREARGSWITAYGEYPKDKLDFLIDSLDRQISFCETLISRLNSKKYASQDDYLMWDAIIKMSYESAAIANELNSY